MRAGIPSTTHILLISLFAGTLSACSPEETEAPVTPKTSKSEDARVRNTLVTDTRQELKKWFKFYNLDADADTLFMLREVWDVSLLTFPVAADWHELYKQHKKLFTTRDDEKRVLDIYTFERNFTNGKRGEVQVNANATGNEVAIVYPEKGERLRLMFCGTPCRFDEAWWRTENEIIVVGLIQGLGETTNYPALWYINLSSNLIRQYNYSLPAKPRKDRNYLQHEVFDKL